MKLLSHIQMQRWSLALLIVVLTLGAANDALAQGSSRRSGRDVHLRIETNRPAYHVGDSIAVRLSLRNISGSPVRFVADPPVVQARLQVYDGEGRLVEPTLPRPL
jgi:hypothetical protein